ncbi:spermine oxidase-like [Uranotaenia lowii]|uniref:spermine oxidase-like n=1 Tax=Uranotaenia lowii TaxID=190385 RepID=UPI0024786601|nr:spermine oxidase-like [Uranotaenia lowii]
MSTNKIIIIGAGASGIAAASRLYESGFRNILILEATDRIGGRIHSVPFGQNIIDLGAQWCHGEKNNAVFELASPLGLLESSVVASEIRLVKSSGDIVPAEITARLMEVGHQIMESEEMNKYDGTVGDFVTDRFMKAANEDNMKDIDRELIQQFLVFLHNYQRGYNSYDSWYNVSASGGYDYEECEGDQALSWMGKGYKSVLDLMLKRHESQSITDSIPIEDSIIFNKAVDVIDWGNSPDLPVTVTCADGSQYNANHVILTVSLGVLKQGAQRMFNPKLPAIKMNAIEGIFFGTVNKIIMEFEKPFWTELGNSFNFLWNGDDLEALRASKYAWIEGASTAFKIDRQPNLLAIWMIGPEGRQSELMRDDDIIDGIMFLLNKFFKGVTIEKPISVIRSKWSTDRNFRGSYSSRSLTTELLKADFQDLSLPLTDCLGTPVLLFAGEATNRKHYATVHGAIESGRREADRLIQLYADKSP